MTWNDWHIIYDDKESAPYKRSLLTQQLINNYLISHKKNIIILSICSGQARDILPAIAGREDKDRITTYLLDIDKDCLEYAQEYACIHDIPNVHTINKDASLKESYDDIPKADLIVICGLFGHLVPEDIATTASFLAHISDNDAHVIWSINQNFNQTIDIFTSLQHSHIAFMYGESFVVATHRINKNLVSVPDKLFNFNNFE
jgi:hypothetical protein